VPPPLVKKSEAAFCIWLSLHRRRPRATTEGGLSTEGGRPSVCGYRFLLGLPEGVARSSFKIIKK